MMCGAVREAKVSSFQWAVCQRVVPEGKSGMCFCCLAASSLGAIPSVGATYAWRLTTRRPHNRVVCRRQTPASSARLLWPAMQLSTRCRWMSDAKFPLQLSATKAQPQMPLSKSCAAVHALASRSLRHLISLQPSALPVAGPGHNTRIQEPLSAARFVSDGRTASPWNLEDRLAVHGSNDAQASAQFGTWGAVAMAERVCGMNSIISRRAQVLQGGGTAMIGFIERTSGTTKEL